MRTYLWFTLAIFAVCALANAILVARGGTVKKTPASMTADLVVQLLVAAWAAHLLLKEVA